MPPFVEFGVKVTLVPAHIVVAVGVTDTNGVNTGFTAITTAVDDAVVEVTQVSDEVMVTVI